MAYTNISNNIYFESWQTSIRKYMKVSNVFKVKDKFTITKQLNCKRNNMIVLNKFLVNVFLICFFLCIANCQNINHSTGLPTNTINDIVADKTTDSSDNVSTVEHSNNLAASVTSNITDNISSTTQSANENSISLHAKMNSKLQNAEAPGIKSSNTGSEMSKKISGYKLPASTCPNVAHPIEVYQESQLSPLTTSVQLNVLGDSPNIGDCAMKCCQQPTCHVAIYSHQQCVGVTCSTMQQCQPLPTNDSSIQAAVIIVVRPPAHDANLDVSQDSDAAVEDKSNAQEKLAGDDSKQSSKQLKTDELPEQLEALDLLLNPLVDSKKGGTAKLVQDDPSVAKYAMSSSAKDKTYDSSDDTSKNNKEKEDGSSDGTSKSNKEKKEGSSDGTSKNTEEKEEGSLDGTSKSNEEKKKKEGSQSTVLNVDGRSSLDMKNVYQPVPCELNMPSICSGNEACISYAGGRRRDGICRCVEGYVRNNRTGMCDQLSATDAGVTTTETTTTSSSSSSTSSKTLTVAPSVGETAGVREESSNNTTTLGSNYATGDINSTSIKVSPSTTTTTMISTTAAPNVPYVPKILSVSVNNKTIPLPDGRNTYDQTVMLSAYVLGECPTCNYEWKVIQQPVTRGKASTSMSEPHSQSITLTRPVEGTYLFSVKVTKPSNNSVDTNDNINQPLAVGSTIANLTIFRPAQRNKPPLVSIVPVKQTVTLPISNVILDGSGSVDDVTDSSKLEFKWEIVTRPLGYILDKDTGPTLKLQNLLPGNYTIMLCVTDEGGLEGNATAAVEVIQEKDYPPSANAGGDQIVYLPQTETIVNGTASTDDHGITEWEWTKGPDDDGLAVDMQDTRTPLLKLAGLEEGHYQFVLKVMDVSGASDTSKANVYVHPPNVAELEANAGPDIFLTLPVVSTALDGTKSTGVAPFTKTNWTQISGPNTANLIPSTDPLLVNVTGLTRGVYIFQLHLQSKDGTKTTKDEVYVSVKQDKNKQPKANGGGDFTVYLPVSMVQVNGTASYDDVGIVRWRWERLPISLAAGHVLGQSASSPVLLLTGLVTGEYQWKLTVWDDQGSYDSDTVSLFVKPGSHQRDHVAVVLGAGIASVNAAHITSLLQGLKLLIPSTISLQMIEYSGLPYTGESSIILLGHDSARLTGVITPSGSTTINTSLGGASGVAGGSSSSTAGDGGVRGGVGLTSSHARETIVPGVELSAMLQDGVKTAMAGSGRLFDLPILDIHTVICQNNCSGHGECDQVRRECVCHSWWMESFVRRHFRDNTPNCDWSVVYVFVSSMLAATVSVTVLWLCITVLLRRRRRAAPKRRTQGGGGGVCRSGGMGLWSLSWLWCGGKEAAATSTSGHRRRAANGSRYTLLEDDIMKLRARSSLLDSCSDSGSDNEVLFDTRSSSSSSKRHKMQDKHKNGHVKVPISRLRA
uniref:Dyslexia-associated protein KIAA0319-like protein n=3 Tax=Hirondellea gigas TaxID=1518452 RepID=A0A6A7G6D6_9CRUS